VRLIEDHGGTCETGRDVERVLVRRGATGVGLTGEEVAASRAVIANVTPTQLYGHPIEGHEELAKRFRYGRSEMQIHRALRAAALGDASRADGDRPSTPGLDGVSRAVNEAERGFSPRRPSSSDSR
jgi:phytoene dehydrogenase-like protein